MYGREQYGGGGGTGLRGGDQYSGAGYNTPTQALNHQQHQGTPGFEKMGVPLDGARYSQPRVFGATARSPHSGTGAPQLAPRGRSTEFAPQQTAGTPGSSYYSNTPLRTSMHVQSPGVHKTHTRIQGPPSPEDMFPDAKDDDFCDPDEDQHLSNTFTLPSSDDFGEGRASAFSGAGVGAGAAPFTTPARSSLGSGNAAQDDRWVTVFGFPAEKMEQVRQFFQKCGEVVMCEYPKNRLANFMHLQYTTSQQALQALGKNGTLEMDPNMMLGVVEKFSTTAPTTVRTLTTPTPHRHTQQRRPLTRPVHESTPNTQQRGLVEPQPQSMVSRAMDYLFGG